MADHILNKTGITKEKLTLSEIAGMPGSKTRMGTTSSGHRGVWIKGDGSGILI